MTSLVQGFAISGSNGVLIRTVSETGRAAIINWLVTDGGLMIYDDMTDDHIESLWEARKDAAGVSLISVAVTPAVAQAQQQPVEDERKAFERWSDSKLVDGAGSASRHRYEEGYCQSETNAQWKAWKARAALGAAQEARHSPDIADLRTLVDDLNRYPVGRDHALFDLLGRAETALIEMIETIRTPSVPSAHCLCPHCGKMRDPSKCDADPYINKEPREYCKLAKPEERATRNSETLASFVEYCHSHPTVRFWQALRNWCGWPFIFAGRMAGKHCEKFDTFNWEGKDK